MSEKDIQPGLTDPPREARLPKRFYKSVDIARSDAGWAVLLDGRTVKTPAKQPLAMPTEASARLLADEWAVQGEHIDAPNMPVTRLCFVALDRMAEARSETAAEVAKYASTDLLCFRAPEPPELVAGQAAAWDPMLAWIEREMGVHLVPASGLMPVDQAPDALQIVLARASALDDIRLTVLAHCTAVTGSAVLGLAMIAGEIDGEKAFALSTLDEHFQISQWGEDHEAAERLARLKTELVAAGKLLAAL